LRFRVFGFLDSRLRCSPLRSDLLLELPDTSNADWNRPELCCVHRGRHSAASRLFCHAVVRIKANHRDTEARRKSRVAETGKIKSSFRPSPAQSGIQTT